ncbi:MAG TPA: hypothetical protein VM536_06880 [Chloroflexia bacterium]|nr:hypothetical protein [Chloroflexia bacterium]
MTYIPRDGARRSRGGLFAVAEALTEAPGTSPGAPLALRHLANAYYASLCNDTGRALNSAAGATTESLRTRVWQGQDAVICSFVALAVHEQQCWLAAQGPVGAYLLDAGGGTWRVLAGLGDSSAGATMPVTLNPGDLLLLASPGLVARVPDAVLRSCLQGLVTADPQIAEQSLAEVLVRLAEGRPGEGWPGAVVVRCSPVAVSSGAAPVARGWPASYPWDFATIQDPPAPAGRVALRAAEPPPPAPVAAPTNAVALAVSLRARQSAAVRPAPPPLSMGALAIGGMAFQAPAALLASTAAGGWLATPRSMARMLLPGTGLLAGGGALGAWMTGNTLPLMVGASVSGLLMCAAALPAMDVAPVDRRGSAHLAKSRLLATTPEEPMLPEPAVAVAEPLPDVLPEPQPAVIAVPVAETIPLAAAPQHLTWAKKRLQLPYAVTAEAGCLDIASLKDNMGRIVAQLVLLCPDHLLPHNGGHPSGVYVLLHDMVTGQRRVTAWLAPGHRQVSTVLSDMAAYGGSASTVHWLRGRPEFELASSRLRIILQVDRYAFADMLRKQQLESLEVTVTAVQAVV